LYPSLKDNKDEVVKLKKGKPTVVNFWSTRCKPCIEEIDLLNSLVDNFPNVNFLAITSDSSYMVNSFLKKIKFKYSVIPNIRNIEIDYKVSANPTHIFIDKNGIIKKIIIGRFEDEKPDETLRWLESQ